MPNTLSDPLHKMYLLLYRPISGTVQKQMRTRQKMVTANSALSKGLPNLATTETLRMDVLNLVCLYTSYN